MTKTITLQDILSDEDIQRCIDLYTQHGQGPTLHKELLTKIVEPQIHRITEKCGQEMHAPYVAYMIEAVMLRGHGKI
jgi:hypothetical protein